MPWADRPPQFGEFLASCNRVARLAVTVRDSTIVKYSLCIETNAFEHDMEVRGTVDGEIYLLGVIRKLSREAQLPI